MTTAPRRRRRFPHDRHIQLLALGAGLPALVLAGVLLFRSDLSSADAVDAPRPRRSRLARPRFVRARGGDPAAADAVEPPRRAARGGLLVPRPGGAARRPPRAGALRGELARPDAARAAARAPSRRRRSSGRSWRRSTSRSSPSTRPSTLQLTNRAGERLLGAPAERLIGLGAEAVGLAAVPRGRGAAHRRGVLPRGLRPLRPAARDASGSGASPCSSSSSPT